MPAPSPEESLRDAVRLHVFGEVAHTGQIPQPPEIARALGESQASVDAALAQLAAGRVLILAPNTSNIWAANPFCAVPSAFHVRARRISYRAICIWDALGIAAALHSDAIVSAQCGDCGDPMRLEVTGGQLAAGEGVIHFAVPAAHWWDNIGYT
jgi:hypothetical protein